jgi:hypothetical protein
LAATRWTSVPWPRKARPADRSGTGSEEAEDVVSSNRLGGVMAPLGPSPVYRKWGRPPESSRLAAKQIRRRQARKAGDEAGPERLAAAVGAA